MTLNGYDHTHGQDPYQVSNAQYRVALALTLAAALTALLLVVRAVRAMFRHVR